jgi:hypothetical protein
MGCCAASFSGLPTVRSGSLLPTGDERLHIF